MEWLREYDWQAWLGLAVVLGVLEMFSLDFVLIMLAVGAAAGMVAALLGAPFALQVLVAGGSALAALAMLRPSLVKRLHGGPELTQGHSRLLGVQCVVTDEISGLAVGRINLAGEVWTATPYDDTMTIPAGETVEVLEIRGATAVVHPVARLEA